MRDGAATVAFRPKLTAEQYAELLDAANEATTKEELRQLMTGLAVRWRTEATCDDTAVLELPGDWREGG